MNKRSIYAALALAIAAGSWALVGGHGTTQAQTSAQAPPPTVTVARTLIETVGDSDEFTGRLQAVDTVQVRPRVGGFIDRVAFQEGASVRKGQLLFQIDPRPAQADVDRLKANLVQARAEQALAQANAERGRKLLAAHAIAREEADRLDTAAQSTGSGIAATAAALRAAALNREFTEVRAPIDGRVSNAQVTAGNLVTPSDVLTRVVSVDPVYAYFDVDEHSFLKLDRLRREHGVPPQVAMELADEDGFPHSGRIDFVDNQLRESSGTIRLRAVFDNADARYTPGLYVRLQLHSDDKRPRALIDDRAVNTDLGNKFVYVLGQDKKVSYRKVELGPLVNGLRVVTVGLGAGDVVVVSGVQHVKPGMQVTPTPVAMQSRRLDGDAPQVAQAGGGASREAKTLDSAQD